MRVCLILCSFQLTFISVWLTLRSLLARHTARLTLKYLHRGSWIAFFNPSPSVSSTSSLLWTIHRALTARPRDSYCWVESLCWHRENPSVGMLHSGKRLLQTKNHIVLRRGQQFCGSYLMQSSNYGAFSCKSKLFKISPHTHFGASEIPAFQLFWAGIVHDLLRIDRLG